MELPSQPLNTSSVKQQAVWLALCWFTSLSLEFLICQYKTILSDDKNGKRTHNMCSRIVSLITSLHWTGHSCLYIQAINTLRSTRHSWNIWLNRFFSFLYEKLILWADLWLPTSLSSEINVLDHRLLSHLQGSSVFQCISELSVLLTARDISIS